MGGLGNVRCTFYLQCSSLLWQSKLHRDRANWKGLRIMIRPAHWGAYCHWGGKSETGVGRKLNLSGNTHTHTHSRADRIRALCPSPNNRFLVWFCKCPLVRGHHWPYCSNPIPMASVGSVVGMRCVVWSMGQIRIMSSATCKNYSFFFFLISGKKQKARIIQVLLKTARERLRLHSDTEHWAMSFFQWQQFRESSTRV